MNAGTIVGMRLGNVAAACVSLGAGLAILASVLTGDSWYRSRNWDTSALQATFDHVSETTDHHLEFYYHVRNNTASDYYVDINSQPTLMAMLEKTHPLSHGYEVIVLWNPIAVPAGQRALVRISFGKLRRNGLKSANLPAGGQMDEQELLNRVNQQFSNVDGFILYDLGRRYRIEFPRGW